MKMRARVRAIDEDDNGAMDEDELEGEATDEDDDVVPGCYPFRVGIENITVWIRADYIRVYKALEDYYDKATKQRGRTPSAVVTGQPGIGESPYFASCTWHSKSRIKAKVFGYIMPLVVASLKENRSSGSMQRDITCLFRRAFTGCPLIGNMLTSVTSCGLWSIQIRAALVFQKISFPKAPASLLYMSHLWPKNVGRVWRRPRGQLRLS
jgi:hypothetical protein